MHKNSFDSKLHFKSKITVGRHETPNSTALQEHANRKYGLFVIDVANYTFSMGCGVSAAFYRSTCTQSMGS